MKKSRYLLLALAFLGFQTAVQAQEKVITRGQEVSTNGNMPAVGAAAPEFTGTDKELKEVSLSSFRGKHVILNIFPSLDTPTCAMSVRHFNEAASALDNTVVLCLSKDLPFAQARFCTVEGIENVIPLSLFRSEAFDQTYHYRRTAEESGRACGPGSRSRRKGRISPVSQEHFRRAGLRPCFGKYQIVKTNHSLYSARPLNHSFFQEDQRTGFFIIHNFPSR